MRKIAKFGLACVLAGVSMYGGSIYGGHAQRSRIVRELVRQEQQYRTDMKSDAAWLERVHERKNGAPLIARETLDLHSNLADGYRSVANYVRGLK